MSSRSPWPLWTLSVLVLAFLWLPLLIILVVSFDTSNYLAFPPQGFTLENYGEVLRDEGFVSGFLLSTGIGVVVALAATVLGLLAALGVRRMTHRRWAGIISALVLSPLLVPHVVLGLAMMLVAARLTLTDTVTAIVIAHIVITLPYAFRTILTGLQTYDSSSEDAARVLGATRPTVLCRVTLPLVAPGVASALVLGFLVSFDESVVVLFIAGRSSTTLPVALLDRIEVGADPVVAALSVVLVLISAGVMLVVNAVFDLRRAVSA